MKTVENSCTTLMNAISLSVTQKTAAYLADQPAAGRQFAIKDASPDIRATLDKAGKMAPVTIRIGHCLTSVVGDTHAIWRSHNLDCLTEFDALFDLLALHPDVPMTFPCEINP